MIVPSDTWAGAVSSDPDGPRSPGLELKVMCGRGTCEVLRARRLQEDPLRAGKIRNYSAISAVTHATSKMASTEAPRETSFKGLARPWTIGPTAAAAPSRSTSL